MALWPARARDGGAVRAAGAATLIGCTFLGNSAIEGGAAFALEDDPRFIGCDFIANVTILDGDVEDDDLPGYQNRTDNVFHVATCDGAGPGAVLDGFTVVGGNAGGGTGAGLLDLGGSPTIANGIFTDHLSETAGGAVDTQLGDPSFTNCQLTLSRAFEGAGIRNVGGHPVLTGCLIADNTNADPGSASGSGGGLLSTGSITLVACSFERNGTSDSGGGASVQASGTTVVHGCDFIDNEGEIVGGGLAFAGGTLDLLDSTFSGNTFRGDTDVLAGGGLSIVSAAATVEGCAFEDNTAREGGGAHAAVSGTDVTLVATTFTANVADFDGAGLFAEATSPSVTDCQFTGNAAFRRGGGMYAVFQQGAISPVLDGCTFDGNSAEEGGGLSVRIGIAQPGHGPLLTACTFTGNVATAEGGGARSQLGEATLLGCTFDGNTAPMGSGFYNVFDGTVLGTAEFLGGDELASTDAVRPGLPLPGSETETILGGLRLLDRGDPDFADNPTLHVDIAGTSPGAFDAIDATGATVWLDGVLDVDFLGGFVPSSGDTIPIVTAGTVSGQFDLAFFPALPPGLLMTLEAGGGGVSIVVEPLEGSIEFADPSDAGVNACPWTRRWPTSTATATSTSPWRWTAMSRAWKAPSLCSATRAWTARARGWASPGA